MPTCTCCQRTLETSAFHKRADRAKTTRSQCKECIRAEKAEYSKKRYAAKRDQILARVKAAYDPVKAARYGQLNRQKHAEKLRVRYHTDLNFRLRCLLRGRLHGALRRGRKSSNTMDLLGCSIERFRTHLEQQFTGDMTWERLRVGDIHIDHIKPCVAFDLSDPEQQRICFHYTNLQPLWAIDNRRKYTSNS